jgi:hypothetical protein
MHPGPLVFPDVEQRSQTRRSGAGGMTQECTSILRRFEASVLPRDAHKQVLPSRFASETLRTDGTFREVVVICDAIISARGAMRTRTRAGTHTPQSRARGHAAVALHR